MTVQTTHTADQLIETLPWRWKVQGVIYLAISLGLLFDAWDVTVVGYLLPLIAASSWRPSPAVLGLFASVTFLGMGVGAAVGGTICDILGRKRTLVVGMLVYGVLTVASALTPNYPALLVTRFAAGLGLGVIPPLVYLAVAEFMPLRIRGLMTASLDFWWPIGATLGGVVATVLLTYHNWRLLMLPMIIPVFLTLLIWRLLPESPRFLVRSGKRDEADRVLGQLVSRTGAAAADWEYPPQEPKRVRLATMWQELRAIWAWNWKVTLAVWVVFTSYNGALYFTVTVWLPTILIKSGYSEYLAYVTGVGVTAGAIVGPWITGWLSERVGRKPVVICSGIISALAMVMFAVTIRNPGVSRAWLAVYSFIGGGVSQPIIFAFVPELYPTMLRGSATGWATACGRLISASVPITVGAWLWPTFGLTAAFGFIGVLVLAGALLTWAFVPEMRGRSLEVVEAEHNRLT